MSPPVRLPLVRFAALQSVVCTRLVGVTGSPLPPRASPFPTGTLRFLPAAVPCLLAQAGSSSRELHSPSEFSRSVPAPRLSTSSAFLGVAFPLRDISQRRRYDGVPPPPPFRPRRFSRPRRFAPPPALRVYFTPQPRPGFSLQGFPSRTAEPARRRPVPSRRWRSFAAPVARCATSPRPALRALFRARVRCPRLRCLAAASILPLVGLSSSRFSVSPP